MCVDCTLGQTDHDSLSTSPCISCDRGRFTNLARTFAICDACQDGKMFDEEAVIFNADACISCPQGKSDHDGDPLTPCEDCPLGRFQNDVGEAGDCEFCEAGMNFMDKRCVPVRDDCTTGYLQGNVQQPSMTCPDGCVFVEAVAAAAATESTEAVSAQSESCTVPVCDLGDALFTNRPDEIICPDPARCDVISLVRISTNVCIECDGIPRTYLSCHTIRKLRHSSVLRARA